MGNRKGDTTDELLSRLLKTAALRDFFENNEDAPQPPVFHEYISKQCGSRGETREHIIKRSGIDRTYGHQLFNGTRKPSRDKVIQLALGFEMDVEETQTLLKIAEKSPLYPRIRRDAAIIYSITQKKLIGEVQELLAYFGMETLGG